MVAIKNAQVKIPNTMSECFEQLKKSLKKLPGFGPKSAENTALYLALENKEAAGALAAAITAAIEKITPCPECGGLSENGEICAICADASRNPSAVCVVEKSLDINAVEKSGAWRGRYHVVGGKLSPMHKITPEKLNIKSLVQKVESGQITEIMLALSNDIEGEATCHYIQEKLRGFPEVSLARIGFGLPSGSQLSFADSNTIKIAMKSGKSF